MAIKGLCKHSTFVESSAKHKHTQTKKHGQKHFKMLSVMLNAFHYCVRNSATEVRRIYCTKMLTLFDCWLVVRQMHCSSYIGNICELIRKMEFYIAFREMLSWTHFFTVCISKHIIQFECNYDWIICAFALNCIDTEGLSIFKSHFSFSSQSLNRTNSFMCWIEVVRMSQGADCY